MFSSYSIIMKKLRNILIIAILAIFAGAGLFARHMSSYAQNPVNPEIKEPLQVIVEPGQSFRTVTERLRQKHLIRHPLKFRILASFRGATTAIKAGEYYFAGSMTPGQILEQLHRGKVHLRRVTVSEGLNLYEVAGLVARAEICEKSAFTQAATDPDLAEKMGIPAKTVEGYLFPETYYFEKQASPEKIIRIMVRRFRDVFSDAWKDRAEELGFSVHEIVILASIIEKETGADKERKTISSVFHNRLEKDMRLHADPTVIYGIENFDGNLTRRDLRTRTPYNTYTNYGLPQGPIANPGRDSLEAALYPADTQYLYFVAKPDNTHHFSATLAEHNRAVRKYQLNQ
ncbi:MAG: endolytic transglycosylase MltG [Desulfobacterales bacterium]